MGFKRILDREFTAPRRTFTGVLLTMLLALTWQLAAPDQDWARLVGIGLQGTVVITALGAAGADPRLERVARISIAVLLALGVAAVIGFDDVGNIIPRSLTLLLILLAPLAIVVGLVREIRTDGRVTLQTVFAGLSLYLLLGMAFSFIFALNQDITGDPFFAPAIGSPHGISGDQNDFLYFSLATLTTTGYGDFTAASELGRTFAVLEALFGQIYLVTVVALLVSNLRRPTTAEMERSKAQYRRS